MPSCFSRSLGSLDSSSRGRPMCADRRSAHDAPLPGDARHTHSADAPTGSWGTVSRARMSSPPAEVDKHFFWRANRPKAGGNFNIMRRARRFFTRTRMGSAPGASQAPHLRERANTLVARHPVAAAGYPPSPMCVVAFVNTNRSHPDAPSWSRTLQPLPRWILGFRKGGPGD